MAKVVSSGRKCGEQHGAAHLHHDEGEAHEDAHHHQRPGLLPPAILARAAIVRPRGGQLPVAEAHAARPDIARVQAGGIQHRAGHEDTEGVPPICILHSVPPGCGRLEILQHLAPATALETHATAATPSTAATPLMPENSDGPHAPRPRRQLEDPIAPARYPAGSKRPSIVASARGSRKRGPLKLKPTAPWQGKSHPHSPRKTNLSRPSAH